MRLSTLALAGLFGGLLLAGNASACHCHKKAAACPAPAPVCAPAPAPVCEPAPVACAAPAKKHCGGGFKMPKMNFGCHKKAAAPACEAVTYEYAPVQYAAPVYAAPQSTPQATHQGM